MTGPEYDEKKRIVVIVGPTAVGKTAAGIFLSLRIGGEIISCDSMQVYREIRIASGRPSEQEMNAVPHHLVGHVSVTDVYDAAAFRRSALEALDGVFSRGRIPVIIGGTGLYLKVLLDGIFDEVGDPAGIRAGLQAEARERGPAGLYEELRIRDPQAALRIHPHNVRRIIRALEICRSGGGAISGRLTNAPGLWGRHHIICFGLTMDRARLYERIGRRVEQMFETGLVDEIRALQDLPVSRTAAAMIGIKEIGAHFSGRFSLEEARREMTKNTRRLAKRQLTWFRAEKRLRWITLLEQEGPQDAARRIEEILNGEPCWTQDR